MGGTLRFMVLGDRRTDTKHLENILNRRVIGSDYTDNRKAVRLSIDVTNEEN